MLLDERYGLPVVKDLTTMSDKADLYAADVDFQEGWEDLVAVAGGAAAELAFGHAMMLVKPDAIVSRRLGAVLEWLPEQGFELVAAVPIALDPGQVKALWRYQFNSAPRIRKEAYQELFAMCPSLLLVVRSTRQPHLAAAQRLADLKGSADPALQRPGDLRARLGNVTHLLSFVHAADEPADVARELAILLRPKERIEIYARMRDRATLGREAAGAIAEGLCARVARHTLGLAEALARIDAVAGDLANSEDRATATALCAAAATGERIDWRILFGLLDRAAIGYDPWDRVTIAAHMSDVANPHIRPLLGAPAPLPALHVPGCT